MKSFLPRSIALAALYLSASCGEAGSLNEVDDTETNVEEISEISAALGPDIPIGDRAVMFQNLNDPTVPSSRTQFRFGETGRCLDVVNYGTHHGAKLQIWTCNGTDNQRFFFNGRSVRGAQSNLCLEAGSNGIDLYMANCDDNPRQRWVWQGSSVLATTGTGTARCVDIVNGATHNGAAVQLWSCHGDGNQVWRRQATILRGQQSGRCLDIVGYGGSSNVNIWDCSYLPHQLWRLTQSGRLVTEVDGRCLRPIGNRRDGGLSLELVDCPDGANTTNSWYYGSDGNLTVNGLCLDVVGAQTHNGASLQTYNCHGRSNQIWHTR